MFLRIRMTGSMGFDELQALAAALDCWMNIYADGRDEIQLTLGRRGGLEWGAGDEARAAGLIESFRSATLVSVLKVPGLSELGLDDEEPGQ